MRDARAGTAELREGHDRLEQGWTGRAHEVVVAFTSTQPRRPGHRSPPGPLPSSADRGSGHLPGASPWLCARVGGHPDRQDEVLTERLPRLLGLWAERPRWWFRRFREMSDPDLDQHLCLYLRLPTAASYGEATARVGAWAAELRDHSLVSQLLLAPYQPETGRYGHGPAMMAAEEVFAADSAAALARITTTLDTATSALPLAAAGMFDLAISYAPTASQGAGWLISDLSREHGKLDRSLRDTALLLADPRDAWAALRGSPGGESVLRAWTRRRTALADYHAVLAGQRDPRAVLRSLLHLHHVRAVGIDPARERLTNTNPTRSSSTAMRRHASTSPPETSATPEN